MRGAYSEYDAERYAPEKPGSSGRTPFERDRARVLHSSALRRLAGKTQVLGPESDDFVRTRLTHSLEVAQIGRAFASNFGAEPDIVETACLCHDLGHPPFGHNGERALAEAAADIGGFEGNAQTLRLLTRLEPKRLHPNGESAGLNLTRAILDATIKYPWDYESRPTYPDGSRTPKFNVYEEDKEVFEWIREGAGEGKSFEAQIMDLSDDIAYSIHDVEDAIVRGATTPDKLAAGEDRDEIFSLIDSWYGEKDTGMLEAAFERLFTEETWPYGFDSSYRALATMKDLTSDLIGRFISSVTFATREKYGEGNLVRYDANIVLPEKTRAEILVLKGIAVAYVMEPRERTPDSDQQRSLLLDLIEALSDNPEQLTAHLYEMYRRSSEKERPRFIIDQVASLTDQSARLWHSRLCGMLRH